MPTRSSTKAILSDGDGGGAVSVGRIDAVAARAVDVARTWWPFRTRVLDVCTRDGDLGALEAARLGRIYEA